MTKICDANLLTLFRHESSNSSTTTNARATSYISAGRSRLVDSRLKEANDSQRNCLSHGLSKVGARRATLRRWGNCLAVSYKTLGGGRDEHGELGDEESGKKGARSPEISAKLSLPPPYTKTSVSPQPQSASQ
ncbi:hypothetical protein PISMIDRAFT_689579 [Pisolithus microcarpus 441]|uniref:Unplaced genomic scaffold scaffold_408, whole genome shotgun sequence n=1 Tax=Pisolithus microcarpus 441 TaxID=765257 RepID=A0A0C9Y5Q0_9AGAM|nr:hypothetical protein PISMIDRAFT_689579 [Pisolithus microcarpus 441]